VCVGVDAWVCAMCAMMRFFGPGCKKGSQSKGTQQIYCSAVYFTARQFTAATLTMNSKFVDRAAQKGRDERFTPHAHTRSVEFFASWLAPRTHDPWSRCCREVSSRVVVWYLLQQAFWRYIHGDLGRPHLYWDPAISERCSGPHHAHNQPRFPTPPVAASGAASQAPSCADRATRKRPAPTA
jgi:hypothetical protein